MNSIDLIKKETGATEQLYQVDIKLHKSIIGSTTVSAVSKEHAQNIVQEMITFDFHKAYGKQEETNSGDTKPAAKPDSGRPKTKRVSNNRGSNKVSGDTVVGGTLPEKE